jgi:hypothetical protein
MVADAPNSGLAINEVDFRKITASTEKNPGICNSAKAIWYDWYQWWSIKAFIAVHEIQYNPD